MRVKISLPSSPPPTKGDNSHYIKNLYVVTILIETKKTRIASLNYICCGGHWIRIAKQ